MNINKSRIFLLPKYILVSLFFAVCLFLMSVSTYAAEEFSAGRIELSASSSKEITYTVKADAKTAFWATEFTCNYDKDIMTFTGIEANSGLTLSYTDKGSSIDVLLYRTQKSNITLNKGDTLIKLHFTVSSRIQPGEYFLSFSYPRHSMVTYTGAVKNLHISGGSLMYGNKVTYTANNNILSSDFAATGDSIYTPLECASSNKDEIFIGWYAKKTSQHKKIFLSPGESFVIGNYDVTLQAVYLEIKTLPGASVYFAQENNDVRLRYVSVVNKKQADFIFEEILGGDSSSFILGTLILPTSYADNNADYSGNGGMNFDALKNDRLAVQTSVPKAPGVWLTQSEVGSFADTDKYYYYDGIINNIVRENTSTDEEIDCNTPFSAIAYLTITYPSGEAIDYFASYDKASHSRSVAYVVERALADVSNTQTDYYKFKIDGVYRPYSSEQMESLYRIKANIT